MYNVTHDMTVGRLGVDLKIYMTHVPDGEGKSEVCNFVYSSLINTRGFCLQKEVVYPTHTTGGEKEELIDFETFLFPNDPSEAEMKLLKMVHSSNWGEVEELITYLCSSLCVHWAGGHEEGTLQSLVYAYTGKIEKL